MIVARTRIITGDAVSPDGCDGAEPTVIASTTRPSSVVRRDDAPTVLATNVARNRGALYVARSMVPFVDYYLPGNAYVTVEDERALPIGAPRPDSWLLTDFRSAPPPRALAFRRAHSRLWSIARRHYFDIALAPVTELPQFGDGWYPPERLGHDEWRWSAGHAVTRLPTASGATALSMTFDIPDDKHPPTITFALNGVIIDRFVPATGRIMRDYRVTAAAQNVVAITVAPTYNELRA